MPELLPANSHYKQIKIQTMHFLIEVYYSDKKVAEYDKCSEAKTKRWIYSYGAKQVNLSEIKEQKTVRFNKNKDKLVIKKIVE